MFYVIKVCVERRHDDGLYSGEHLTTLAMETAIEAIRTEFHSIAAIDTSSLTIKQLEGLMSPHLSTCYIASLLCTCKPSVLRYLGIHRLPPLTCDRLSLNPFRIFQRIMAICHGVLGGSFIKQSGSHLIEERGMKKPQWVRCLDDAGVIMHLLKPAVRQGKALWSKGMSLGTRFSQSTINENPASSRKRQNVRERKTINNKQ